MKTYLKNAYMCLILATALVVGLPERAEAQLIPSISGSLVTTEAQDAEHSSGDPTITLHTKTGATLAINRGNRQPSLVNWGWDYLFYQLPTIAAGQPVRPVKNLTNDQEIGTWLPERNGYAISADEIARQIQKVAAEATIKKLPFDAKTWSLNFEQVSVIVDGKKKTILLLSIIPIGTIRSDQAVANGFTIHVQNTWWDPNAWVEGYVDPDTNEPDRHQVFRPEAHLRAELEDWYEAGVTAFEPVSNSPGAMARGARRDQQLRDPEMTQVVVRYELSDGALAQYVLPNDTCLYWFVPESLLLSETQLAISVQRVAGQEYYLLPAGSEPALPAHWKARYRDQLKDMRVVKISKTFTTGAEIVFEIPHQILDWAPAQTIQQGVDDKGMPAFATFANYLVLGTSQADVEGKALFWKFVEGSDLVSFTVRRPTAVAIRLREAYGAAEPEKPRDPVQTLGE